MKTKIFETLAVVIFSGLSGNAFAQSHLPAMISLVPDSVTQQVQDFVDKQNGHPVTIDLKSSDPKDGLIVACPMGLICPSADYALSLMSFVNNQQSLLFSFDIKSLQGLTVDVLRAKFQELTYIFQFPEALISIPGYAVQNAGLGNVIEPTNPYYGGSVVFDSFENGILSGHADHTVPSVEVVLINRTPEQTRNCEGMEGIDLCSHFIDKVSIPVHINFSLPVSAKAMDCTSMAHSDKLCGL